jgi:hypothetical protein
MASNNTNYETIQGDVMNSPLDDFAIEIFKQATRIAKQGGPKTGKEEILLEKALKLTEILKSSLSDKSKGK